MEDQWWISFIDETIGVYVAKKSPRNISDVAIDCAIHRMQDPGNGWRSLIPPPNIGQMLSAGSGQIGLQALVAQLHYDGAKAIPTLENYYKVCSNGRFMLSEPWSVIYGRAIVNCWAATVLIAERKGFADLASKYRSLLSTWRATLELMHCNGLVMIAGCRSWGFPPKIMGFHEMYALKVYPPNSRQYGTPGADDDWGWRIRCEWLCKDIYGDVAALWRGKSPEELVAQAPRWGARTEMTLFGWADGSRLWIMGDDEPEFDDEDPNSNTPGLLAAGVLGGQVITAPKWPCKDINGKPIEHLRQTNVVADIDGSPIKGWQVKSSHLGDYKLSGTGYMVTDIPSYKPAELIFSIRIPADTGLPPQWEVSDPRSLEADTVVVKPVIHAPSHSRSIWEVLKNLWPF